MAERTIFDEIIDGNIPSWKVWEDEQYLAFLTPFASTPGATVVIPKKNPGDYVFNMEDDAVAGLMRAAKETAKLLEKALGVERVALVFEGEAVPHVHAKLYPMHGFDVDRSHFPKETAFFPVYPGYIDTRGGPKMSDDELNALQKKIQEAAA
jgi:diadenosine tetraphosphate (Ap4A) HIT family hydrolase